MNKSIVTLSAASLLVMLSTPVLAAQVEFLGSIQAVSCDVIVNTQNQVSMKTVTQADFVTANTPVVNGQTDFQLTLSGCSTAVDEGTLGFQISGDVVAGTNNIFVQKSNNVSAQGNSGIAILNSNVVVANNGIVSAGSKTTAGDAPANTNFNLTAAYMSTAITDSVTTGNFRVPVEFAVIYN